MFKIGFLFIWIFLLLMFFFYLCHKQNNCGLKMLLKFLRIKEAKTFSKPSDVQQLQIFVQGQAEPRIHHIALP